MSGKYEKKKNHSATKNNWLQRCTKALSEACTFRLGSLIFAIVSTVLCVGACCCIVGYKLLGYNNADVYSWINSTGLRVGIGVAALVLLVLLYFAAQLIYGAYQRAVDSAQDHDNVVLSYRDTLHRFLLKYWGVIALCWLP